MTVFKNKFDLTNKTALITGSAGLLGIEHAKALLEKGANVILTDLNKDDLVVACDNLKRDETKGRIFCHVMDVTEQESIKVEINSINDFFIIKF